MFVYLKFYRHCFLKLDLLLLVSLGGPYGLWSQCFGAYMDAQSSMQGPCTLADNLMFSGQLCFMTNQPMICNRIRKLECLTGRIQLISSGLLLVLSGNANACTYKKVPTHSASPNVSNQLAVLELLWASSALVLLVTTSTYCISNQPRDPRSVSWGTAAVCKHPSSVRLDKWF